MQIAMLPPQSITIEMILFTVPMDYEHEGTICNFLFQTNEQDNCSKMFNVLVPRLYCSVRIKNLLLGMEINIPWIATSSVEDRYWYGVSCVLN
jgi:hypothetical protein